MTQEHRSVYFAARFGEQVKIAAFNNGVLIPCQWTVGEFSMSPLILRMAGNSFVRSEEAQISDLDIQWETLYEGQLMQVSFTSERPFDPAGGAIFIRALTKILRVLVTTAPLRFDPRLSVIREIHWVEFPSHLDPPETFAQGQKPKISLASKFRTHAKVVPGAVAALGAAFLLLKGPQRVEAALKDQIKTAEFDGRRAVRGLLRELNRLQGLRDSLAKISPDQANFESVYRVLSTRKEDIAENIENITETSAMDVGLMTPASAPL